MDVEREPARQEHDLDRNVRHPAPGKLSEERERDAGEDVAGSGAAALENRRPSARHVGRLRVIARELQREIHLDAAAHVEGPAVIERPASVSRLALPEVSGELRLERGVELSQEVHHHDVLGRNGAVRLELELPRSIRTLKPDQLIARRGDRILER